MARQVFQNLRTHFNELNLADRYRLMGLEHLGGQYPAFHRAYGRDRNAGRVSAKLSEDAKDFEDVFGPNYWLKRFDINVRHIRQF